MYWIYLTPSSMVDNHSLASQVSRSSNPFYYFNSTTPWKPEGKYLYEHRHFGEGNVFDMNVNRVHPFQCFPYNHSSFLFPPSLFIVLAITMRLIAKRHDKRVIFRSCFCLLKSGVKFEQLVWRRLFAIQMEKDEFGVTFDINISHEDGTVISEMLH